MLCFLFLAFVCKAFCFCFLGTVIFWSFLEDKQRDEQDGVNCTKEQCCKKMYRMILQHKRARGKRFSRYFKELETYRFLLENLKVMFPFSTDTVTLCLNVS